MQLPIALLLALVLLHLALSERLEQAVNWIDADNVSTVSSGEPLVVARRRELFDREAAIANVAQERSEAFDTYESNSDAYYAKVAELNKEQKHLERGDGASKIVAAPK